MIDGTDVWEDELIEIIDSDDEHNSSNDCMYVAYPDKTEEQINVEQQTDENNYETESVENEIVHLLPKVVLELSKYGTDKDLLAFFPSSVRKSLPFR